MFSRSTTEQIVDAHIPQVMEEIIEVIILIPPQHIQQFAVEEIVLVSVPLDQEQTVFLFFKTCGMARCVPILADVIVTLHLEKMQ